MAAMLLDAFRHNSWATAELLGYCRGLDDATLRATVPGTYGSIVDTLAHTIKSEASYLSRLAGAWPGYPWPAADSASLDALAERAAELAPVWERFLAGEVDTERTREGRGDDGTAYQYAAGVFLAQALHHANEHRAQVCTILGALGYEPPEVSAWAYAFATGRGWEEPGQ
jgi:uncharacterized damage-inducible protein DinB